MYRKEVNERSPLRILERSTQGGVGAGNLGVVMARAGVGKTAFLVQTILDDALRERPVLHVALGQSLDHVHAWYDALFDDLAGALELENRETNRTLVYKNSVIQAYSDDALTPERLEQAVALYEKGLEFKPAVLVIDGYDWESPAEQVCPHVEAFKATARRLGAELWMSAQTHREVVKGRPSGVTPPCKKAEELIDVAVFLEPEGQHVSIRLLKDHDDPPPPPEVDLLLDPDTLRLVREGEGKSARNLLSSGHTLLSGGHVGAETAFGEAAERYGMREVTYTHIGRTPERARGVTELTDADLRRGAVSDAYIESHLNRKFPDTDEFHLLLQTIWHQVATAGQVFVVGSIQDDDTVHGGTGWAAELARHFKKQLHVFDQPRGTWFRWDNVRWLEVDPPKIESARFTGTGTQNLDDAGRKAIDRLFADSFGDR